MKPRVQPVDATPPKLYDLAADLEAAAHIASANAEFAAWKRPRTKK